MPKTDDLKVFWIRRDTECAECGVELPHGSTVFLEPDKGAICMACADLDHLWFLPRGDAALTRRAKKHSTLSAVVLEWNRRRKRYERQGLLVEDQAIDKAEEECLADADVRARRRQREAERRLERDEQYVNAFAQRIRELYPGCPENREQLIAEHACRKYSGRVGRSAAAKEFDKEAIRLAVTAHIRHNETNYDHLLAASQNRHTAREAVKADVNQVLAKWRAT